MPVCMCVRNIQHCTKVCLQYLLFHKKNVMPTPAIKMPDTTAIAVTTSVSLNMKRFINQQLQKLYKGL